MPKPKVHSTASELLGAFRSHYKAYKTDMTKPSYQLLLFYAVECGLKYLYLSINNLNSTTSFDHKIGKPYGHAHDIPRWVDELKISVQISPFTENIKDPIENVHEKLRYGVSSNSQNLSYLQSIAKYLNKQI